MHNVLAPQPTKAVWGPIMDMAEYPMPNAIFLRQKQENMADVREQRTSAMLDVFGEKPPEDTNVKRGRILPYVWRSI